MTEIKAVVEQVCIGGFARGCLDIVRTRLAAVV
jgi:hypothetical protein